MAEAGWRDVGMEANIAAALRDVSDAIKEVSDEIAANGGTDVTFNPVFGEDKKWDLGTAAGAYAASVFSETMTTLVTSESELAKKSQEQKQIVERATKS